MVRLLKIRLWRRKETTVVASVGHYRWTCLQSQTHAHKCMHVYTHKRTHTYTHRYGAHPKWRQQPRTEHCSFKKNMTNTHVYLSKLKCENHGVSHCTVCCHCMLKMCHRITTLSFIQPLLQSCKLCFVRPLHFVHVKSYILKQEVLMTRK